MDDNIGSDDTIGATTIKLSSLCVNNGLDEWFELQYKGKPAGHIHLKSEWEPHGQELVEPPRPEYTPRP